ncbi:MAG: CarD family transcriptional regulator [Clostridia bacterium]|nr:CarD family transcriptional regulator [Clostridia bacterium]
MLKIGSLVIYGVEGVCQISEIVSQSFAGSSEKKDYYVMIPVHNSSSKLYVPVDNEKLASKIKQLLTYDEIIELIEKCSKNNEWIADNKLRSKYYKEVMASYDREKIFSLARILYLAKSGKIPEVKKLYVMDEDVLRKTSHILYSEFSYVVELEYENVLPFIAGEIVCKRK